MKPTTHSAVSAGSIKLNVLVENTTNVGRLGAEHGLAFLLRTGQHKLLFDTGQSELLLLNAQRMGLSLEGLDAIVLSHGHYDHSGGLAAAWRESPQARLYVHPAALAPKFVANLDGASRSIGMPAAHAEVLRQAGPRLLQSTGPTEVLEGIFVTGEIPRLNSFEDTGGRFFLDEACTQVDPLLDDQALYFDTSEGLVVVLGCAHSGVVNTLDYIGRLTQGRRLFALVGGMHLLGASPQRIERTLEALRRWDIQKLFPAHCTGMAALVRLWTALPERCAICPAGTSLVFHR